MVLRKIIHLPTVEFNLVFDEDSYPRAAPTQDRDQDTYQAQDTDQSPDLDLDLDLDTDPTFLFA